MRVPTAIVCDGLVRHCILINSSSERPFTPEWDRMSSSHAGGGRRVDLVRVVQPYVCVFCCIERFI